MLKIGCVSQKGGVGKSTLARLVAREYANHNWDVHIADLDTKQKTSSEWLAIRRERDLKPYISVEPYRDVKQALKTAKAELLVFDGKPSSSVETREIAKNSDAVFLPTGYSRDDLFPTVKLAHELVAAGIKRNRIMIVFVRASDSSSEYDEAASFVQEAGYRAAKYILREKTLYRQAMNAGQTLSECSHRDLRVTAKRLGEEMAEFASGESDE